MYCWPGWTTDVCVEDCHRKSDIRTRAIVESSKVNSDSSVSLAKMVRAGGSRYFGDDTSDVAG
jgi:hypothetical protein